MTSRRVRGLAFKILFAALVPAAFAGILIATAVLVDAQGRIAKQADLLMSVQAARAAAYADVLIAGRQADLFRVVSSAAPGTSDADVARALAGALRAANGRFQGLYRVSPDGQVLAWTGQRFAISERPHWSQALGTGPAVNLLESTPDQSGSLLFGEPLVAGGRSFGWILATVSLSDFTASARLDGSTEVLLEDRAGGVSGSFDSGSETPKLLRGARPNGTLEILAHGEPHAVAMSALRIPGWRVVLARPKADLQREARGREWWSALVVCAFLALGSAITLALVWRALGPLRRLAEDFSRIAGGGVGTLAPVGDPTLDQLTAQLNDTLRGLEADRLENERLAEVARAQSDRLQRTLAQMPIPCMIFDKRGIATFWNPMAERVFGWTHAEIADRPFWEYIIRPELREPITHVFENLDTATEPIRNTNENVTRDGRTIVCEWINTPVRNEAGRTVEYMCMGLEITDAHRVRQELETSRALFRAVIDGLPFSVWAADRERRLILKNAWASRSIDVPLGAPIQSPPLTEDIARGWAGAVDHVLDSGPLHSESTVHVDGLDLVLESYLQPVVVGGETIGVAGATINITKRRSAERAALDNEARLRDIFLAAPFGMFRTTLAGVALEANPAMAHILGYDCAVDALAAVNGGGIESLWEHPAQRAPWLADLRASDGAWKTSEMRLRRRDGRLVDCVISVSLRADPGSGETTLFGFVQDITEGKRAELEKRRTEQLTLMGQLASGIAHDFNNMLGGILSFADLIAARAQESTIREYARLVIENVSRASTLTRGLVRFARQRADVPADFELHDVVRAALDLFAATKSSEVGVSLDLATDGVPVRGYPAQLQNAVLNLCLNAQDAMPDGGTLTVRAERVTFDPTQAVLYSAYLGSSGSVVHLSIADTGVGMDDETRARCLDAFFTTKGDRGTGLGLASVRRAVSDHHGALDITSSPGAGSTFHLYLPVAAARAETESARRRGRVLVVEDEPHLREYLAGLLREYGFLADEVEDGDEALAWLDGHRDHAALMLLDLTMKRVSGAETLKRARGMDPQLPIVLATGCTDEALLEELQAMGAVGVLRKPLEREHLLDVVRRFVEPDAA